MFTGFVLSTLSWLCPSVWMNVVYDSCAHEILVIVTRACSVHQLLAQVTVVVVEWVTKVATLV